MFVKEVAKELGITYEQVRECFLDDYAEEDAKRFWNEKWETVKDTWLFYSPVYNLFKGALNEKL